MFIRNNKRFDVYGAYVINGESFGAGAFLNQEIRDRMQVTMLSDPAPPDDYSPDTYDRREINDAPYVVYTRKSDEQIQALMLQRYEQALDEHLDKAAQEDRWSNRFTFVARAGYPNRWQQEAIAFGIWMDSCNEHAYALLQKVVTGEVPMPTLEEFIAGLPEYVKQP
jgi:hypothetical protein